MIALALLAAAQAAPAIPARIERLLTRAPVIDGHNDLAWEIREGANAKVETVDLKADTTKRPHPLQTDIPRARAGHLGGQFWSVYIPASITGPAAVETTLEEIDIVRRFVAANPDAFAMATTADDIRRIQKSGRIASLLGVEGGHQIDGRLSVLREYKALGVGYMTLTHSKSLDWADSATDGPRANGLSDFGRKVVAEMNRIGMIVDVSHVSDATMAAALAASKAPVMASHSSARALADAPRNIPDDLLRAIGANGGVVMVNFYPAFLSRQWRAWDKARTDYAKSVGVPADVYGPRSAAPLVAWDAAHPEPLVTAATVADHVAHVARVAGVDHVGIGGDYDGISGTGPVGMKGVDGYPKVFAELARRGWSDTDLVKLSQGNILRVMERVEAVAKASAGMPPVDATAPN
ncbi:Membrane dipeptidase [Sphingomonas sp. EC-HK361]|uniref:dipeptidase n=1 Tax=Sphingomonas sp. EC-HK361 TaxID=2038397 RepID=UPI00125ADDD7|nr:dipeptidase [Sphingomonas sp. EC-HK361]VVS97812.1 Membrane dipeptidase [Sphingomonas sp. EC-HK361]